MVLSCNKQEGTVWLLDILAQLRKVRARVSEATEESVTLHGRVGDLQDPEINFNSAAGPTTYDSRGVVEDWTIEPDSESEEEEEETENDTISVSTDATEPLEVEETEESFFQYSAEEDIENQRSIENDPITARSTEVPEDDVSSWLESTNVTEPSETKKKAIDGRFKTPYLRRSRRLRNQRRNASTPWR